MKNPLRFLRRMATNKSGQTSSVPVEKPIGNPKSYTMEILLEAIHQGHVSIMDFPTLSGFRMRLSEIRRHGIEFNSEKIKLVNKYGRDTFYQKHHLSPEQKINAIKLYNRLYAELK